MKRLPNLLESIGETPLIRLEKFGRAHGIELLGKAEFFNPWGSVKDRIGRAMIEDAELFGRLKPGQRVVEPTSGNTGIALAFVCAAKGYPLTITMPETASLERRTLLLLLGAELVLTPGPLGMRGAIAKAIEIQRQTQAFMPAQFENAANPEIHHKTTAEEIWSATDDGQFDVFIAGVGTGGTISGCARLFKARKPAIQVYAVEPTESAVLSGGKPAPHKIQGIGGGFVPKNLDRSLLDGIVQVSSDEALATAKAVLRLEGLPAGISTGAALHAAIQLAPQFQGRRMVVVLPSYTERYLSTLLAEAERTQAQALVAQPVDEGILATLPVGPS
jgi:cysteine synthase A